MSIFDSLDLSFCTIDLRCAARTPQLPARLAKNLGNILSPELKEVVMSAIYYKRKALCIKQTQPVWFECNAIATAPCTILSISFHLRKIYYY